VLAGGSYLDWYRLVTPGSSTTRLSAAVRAARDGGATVVGLGPAAPFLAEWAMVERAAIGKPERNPRRPRADLAVRGLGLLPGLLVDSSACERGSPARLLRATLNAGLDRALYLDGPTAWVAEPRRHSARVVGAGRTLLFDFTTARRNRAIWRDARVAALSEGDRWSRREGVACAREAMALEDLWNSLRAAPAVLTLHGGRSGTEEAACETVFDLEWAPSGS
jgi:cyanophycinase-like exopeptidase